MKFASVLFLGLTLTVLLSCGGKKAKIMKTWKLDGVRAEVLFQFEENDVFSIQSENLDGTVSKNKGKWKFGSGKESVLMDLNQNEQEFKIEELTDKKLVLLPVGEKMKMSFSVKE